MEKEIKIKGKCFYKDCCNVGDLEAILGEMPIYYCFNHRQTGRQILDFLIISKVSDKVNSFLKIMRKDIYKNKIIQLSKESEDKLKEYTLFIQEQIKEVENEIDFMREIEYGEDNETIKFKQILEERKKVSGFIK
jgi:hypothetical protein